MLTFDSSEILKKVRYLEIKSKVISEELFSGKYQSAFKGVGIKFNEIREYSYGDDLRSIDWKVTARFDHPFIKIFEEEREISVLLLIDVSNSNSFGIQSQLKSELITELASIISYSAIKNNDKVGLIFFSEKIEKFIPPQKGTSNLIRIILEMLNFKSELKTTNITAALEFLLKTIKKRSIVFLVSDFFDDGYENLIAIAKKKHDLIIFRIEDKGEHELPSLGLVKLMDPESGKIKFVDTDSSKYKLTYKKWWIEKTTKIESICSKTGVDLAVFQTGQDYIKVLLHLFSKREKRI